MTIHWRSSRLQASLAAIAVACAVCLAAALPDLPLVGARSRLTAGQSAGDGATERDAVTIAADMSQEWTDGSVHVLLLRGRCRIVQGQTVLTARKMVVFHGSESGAWETRDRLTVYLEDDVRIDRPGQSVNKSTMVVHLVTRAGVTSQLRSRADHSFRAGLSESGSKGGAHAAGYKDDPLYRRAERRLSYTRRTTQSGPLLQTQLTVPGDPHRTGLTESGSEGGARSVQIQSPPGNLRRVRISPRSAVPYNVLSFESTETTPPEQVWVLTGGINVLIDGVGGYGTVDLSADRMVIWTQKGGLDQASRETVQTRDTPFQVYLEGNIVIRQGGDRLALSDPFTGGAVGDDFGFGQTPSFVEQQRRGELGEVVLRATRAVYDAREERALLLNAELKTFIPQINGNLRIRAERIRQQARNSFHAQNAWLSGSEFAKPGYRLQASDIFYEPRVVNPFLGPQGGIDPVTGLPIVTDVPWITSLNNAFFIEDVPLFYTPFLAAPAEKPNIPLRNATISQDRVFGGQLETVWNMFTLLGMEEPDGVRWDLYADYFTERGPAVGSGTEYHGIGLFGIPGSYTGQGMAWGILDGGKDNLGADRKALEPESDARGRVLLRHRHFLPNNVSLIAEIGLLSDRNFLEQYFESEFNRNKDNETLLFLQQQFDNLSWSALVRPQVNDFENTTEWLPRGDLTVLSEPLFGGLLNWSSHTSAAFADLEPAAAPTDPADLFDPLPFVADVGGAVLMTRHELDMPLNVGPINLVPYLLGEAAYWSEDLTGASADRFVGSAGVRGSVLFWRVFPSVYSRIFNLNGLAHKVRLEADYSFTDSTKDFDEIAQYNEFDDNAQERFRERFLMNTFGGTLPDMFEPRFYAVRSGAGRAVTAPYHELIDDQQVLRLALRQRLQTKVGPPERLRIRDWMRLDLEASFFPNPGRDNFGEDVGLLGGQYRWNFGDRTRLDASAYFDLFDDAQQLWNVGLFSQRDARGSVYLGIRQVKGAGLDSQILTASYSYIMGPKWISSFATSYDLGEGRNNGQSLVITRVGSDFLIHFGVNYDASKNNAGIALSVEPRFGLFNGSSPVQLGSLLNPGGSYLR